MISKIKLYIRQAWQLIRQNKFFSLIYILGTAMAISMVMVVVAVYHIQTINMAPENHRDRMCYISELTYKSSDHRWNSCIGERFIKNVVERIKTAENIAITSEPEFQRYDNNFVHVTDGNKLKTILRSCNAQYWKIYDFSFIDGKPFSEEDFQSGIRKAVICRSLARQLFGTEQVSGHNIWINDIEYLVCGVVEDVSSTFTDTFSELWLPYTSTENFGKSYPETENSCGQMVINILLRDKKDLPTLKTELENLVNSYNNTLKEGKVQMPEIQQFGLTILGMGEKESLYLLGAILLLFLLVPALNLSGLNSSHIQDRLEEIGIRKAFGASHGSLFSQIVTENFILMLPGGLVGLLFSYLLIFLFKDIILASNFHLLLGDFGKEVKLTAGMLINWQIFVGAFFACLLLNLLSSLIPVWNAIHTQIIGALNKRNY